MMVREVPRWVVVGGLCSALVGSGLGMARTTTNWLDFTQTHVDSRNAALVSGSWEDLAALTAADSPARRADEELWAWLVADGTSVETILTQVRSAQVVDRRGPVLEVISVQVGAHLTTNESDNAGEPLCRRWHLREEKLVDVRPCPQEG